MLRVSAQDLGRPGIVVLDSTSNVVADSSGHERIVAERETYLAGHIPGARFVDLQQDLSDTDAPFSFTLPDAARLQRGLRHLGIERGDTVVVYSTGNPWWATRVWWLLHVYGLANARLLDGGFRHWKQRGLPVESGEPAPWPEGDAEVSGDASGHTIDADALLARLGDTRLALVNALPPDKFAGKSPVHGGRPGHIPGSVNLPAAALIDPATGLLVDAQAREKLLRAAGLLDTDRDVVAYCGGGISATLVLFALALAGRDDSKLYDASLGEWAKREDLPLSVSLPATPAA